MADISCGILTRKAFQKYWRYFIIVVFPILLLALPLTIKDDKSVSAYLLILMAVFWMTEALPLAVTGLIPLFFAPMMGLLAMADVAMSYMKSTTISSIGSLCCALAIEKSKLHKRIALKILLGLGTQFKWLMLGFMIPTFLMSMFIVNTASTATMLPVVEAVLEQLDPDKLTANQQVDETDASEVNSKTNGNINNVASGKPSKEEDDIVMTSWRSNGQNNPSYVDDLEKGTTLNLSPNDETNLSNIQNDNEKTDQIHTNHTATESDIEYKRDLYQRMSVGLTIACVYAANIGGTGALTGTTPNLIMQQYANDLFQAKGFANPVTYATWMVYGFPTAVIVLLLTWLWLQVMYLRKKEACSCCDNRRNIEEERFIRKIIIEEYKKLGNLRYHEVMVLIMFIALVLLWFFREPGFMTGWSASYKDGYIETGVPAILISVGFFIIPSQIPSKKIILAPGHPDALLDWKLVHSKFPWVLLFIFGGGYALADVTTSTGLADWIGEKLSNLESLPPVVLIMILCLCVALLTEVSSNPATCTLLMPIAASIAENMNRNPLFLMFPVCVSTCFSFMLPVATPPNALAFTYGRVKVIDMFKAGAFINVYCVLVVTLTHFTWGDAYFNFDYLPWGNNTLLETSTASN